MLKALLSYLSRMMPDFARIARQTRYEFTADDLHNDAYVLALELGDRRGKHLDLSDPEDRDLLLGALHTEKVKRGDWKIRHSVRIDEEADDEEGGLSLAERLPATESSDPAIWLVMKEKYQNSEVFFKSSFSQAAAYVVTFDNLGNDRQRVCNHLAISSDTLSRRVSHAANVVRQQPSVFDGLERIPSDFLPKLGNVYIPIPNDSRESEQLIWAFDDTCGGNISSGMTA